MRFVFCLTLAVLGAACDYEPSGENYVDLEEPSFEGVTLDLMTPGDTLGLWGTVSVPYRVDTQGRPISYGELYLDDERVATFSGSEVPSFSSRRYADGAYELTLRVYAESESGNLAEAVGAEVLVLELERVAVIDNAPPDAVTVLPFGERDGYLEINWEPYTRPNFEAYRVVAEAGSDSRVVATITDPDSTSCLDSLYVGGRSDERVEVIVEAAGQQASAQRGLPRRPPPHILYTESDSSSIRVVWKPTSYHAAVESYDLYRISGYDRRELVASTQDGRDSVYVDVFGDEEPTFGTAYSYELATTAGGRVYVISDRIQGWVGNRIGWESEPVWYDNLRTEAYFPEADTYLFIGGLVGTARLVEARSLEVIADLGDGRHVAAPSGAALYQLRGGSLDRLDPETGASVASVGYRPLIGFDKAAGLRFASDAGMVVLSVDRVSGNNSYTFQGSAGIDVATGALVFADTERRVVALSHDGQYAIADNRTTGEYDMVRIEEAALTVVGSFPRARDGWGGPKVVALGTDEFAIMWNADVSILRAEDAAVVRSFPAEIDGSLHYDPTTGLIAGYAGDEGDATLSVYDPAMGTLRAQVETRSTTPQQYRLVNGTMWLNGYYQAL